MNKEVESMMDKSPRPLPWTIAMITLTVTAAVWHSVILGMLAGVLIGAYFGNYRGRFAIMQAWKKQLDVDHKERMSELEAEYRALGHL